MDRVTTVVRTCGLGLLLAATVVPTQATAQTGAPSLSREQRATLTALVSAADSLTPQDAPVRDWPVHVLRASDGSHYVAFSVTAAPMPADRPLAVYVRLSRRVDERTATVERSLIAEWLSGKRTTPPPPPRRGIVLGEMPAFGAAAAGQRTQTMVAQTAALLDLERERTRARREDRERERKAILEGEAPADPSSVLPFEDFDLAAQPTSSGDGSAILQRSLTAGPGEYYLSVAWADAAKAITPDTVTVVRRRLSLPPASTTAFVLSGIVLADSITARDSPLSPEQQTGRPYTIGTMEIAPARDSVLTSDERLAFVVQVVNPRASADGKPDVTVHFRVVRTTPGGQQHVGDLVPQSYNRSSLPADFDSSRGHPLFAAVAVPLATFKRGDYKLQAMAEDHVAGVSASTETTFSVVATPAALLRDAPPLSAPFRRASILTPALRHAIVASLRPKVPSVSLTAALDAMREGQFVDLLKPDTALPEEQAVAATLRAFGLYALGDTPRVIAAALQRATQTESSPAAHLLAGALRAIEGSDADAMGAWTAAIEAGLDAALLAPAMIDAQMRQGRYEEAVAAAAQRGPGDADLTLRLAAATLAAGRAPAAIETLDRHLETMPADLDGQWLRLHALFAIAASGQGDPAAASARQRFKSLAPPYVDAKAAHSALAAEWLAALP